MVTTRAFTGKPCGNERGACALPGHLLLAAAVFHAFYLSWLRTFRRIALVGATRYSAGLVIRSPGGVSARQSAGGSPGRGRCSALARRQSTLSCAVANHRG